MTIRRLLLKKHIKVSALSLLVLICGAVWILSISRELRGSSISLEDTETKHSKKEDNADAASSSCNDAEALLDTIETDTELLLYRNRTKEGYLQTFVKYSSAKDSPQNNRNNKNKVMPLREPLRIVHVWSPYVVHPKNNTKSSSSSFTSSQSFAPLDQAQNVTWESMYLAQRYVHDNIDPENNMYLEVKIYCAIFWFDVDILQAVEPPLCRPDNTIVLKRSTVTEHPDITPLVHLPFVQDIMDPILKNHTVLFDYLILTNSDIALIEPFYILAATSIRKYGYEAFVVNRRTISKGSTNTNSTKDEHPKRLWTSNDIDYLQSSRHAVPRSIVSRTRPSLRGRTRRRSDAPSSPTSASPFVGTTTPRLYPRT
jgi:hypothetical protein